jgi:hypothetical protein
VDPRCRPASRPWLKGDPPGRQISERRRRRRPINKRLTLRGGICRGIGRGGGRNGGRQVGNGKRRRAGGSRLIGRDRAKCSEPEEYADQKPDRAEPVRERRADQNCRRERERGSDAKKAVARRDGYNADKGDVPVSKSPDGRQDEWPAGAAGWRRCRRSAVASTQRGIFANQLGVLLAELFVELLRLVRAVKHASKAAAVALKDGAHPHKRGHGFTILMGIHHTECSDEHAFVTFRTGG